MLQFFELCIFILYYNSCRGRSIYCWVGGFYDNFSIRNKQNFQYCCSSLNVYDDFYDYMFFDFRFKF